MTRTALTLLSTAFALGVAGAANAQSGMDPMTMTCADLAALGQEEMQGALDMMASNESMAITGATGTSAPATGTTGSSGSTATGTDSTAGATTGTTGTTGSSSDTTTAGSTTGTAGSSSTSTDTTAGAATGTTGTSGSASSDSSTMAAGSMDQMQIDAIMSACAESPERLVSDVYRENAGADQ